MGCLALDRWFQLVMILLLGGFLALAPLFSARPMTGATWVVMAMGVALIVAGFLGAVHIGRGRERQIVVDFDAMTVTFENYRVGRAFSVRMPRMASFRIGFDEVLGVEIARSKWSRYLHIITTRGKVVVNESATNFRELRLALEGMAARTARPPLPYRQRFIAVVTYVVAALTMGGLFLAFVKGWLEPVLKFLDR